MTQQTVLEIQKPLEKKTHKDREHAAEIMQHTETLGQESDLAPDQHCAEDHLQAVKEVVSDEDDRGAAGGPAFTRTDGFDAGSGCFETHRDSSSISDCYTFKFIRALEHLKLWDSTL